MNKELEYRVAELERRLFGMVRICTIKELKDARVTVQAGELVTGPLPWLTRRAGNDRDFWAPEPGEQALLVCPYGDPDLGIVIPAIYRETYPAPAENAGVHRVVYSDGAKVEYDREAHVLKADIPGSIEAEALKINATAPEITFNGAVLINGPLTATQMITSAAGVAAPSIKVAGKETNGHDHICPDGDRTSQF